MSLNFTNILNKVRRATGTDTNSYTSANIAIDVNLAQDEAWAEALKTNGWNVDDFNQTDYPIVYKDLVSGQRDYTFILDESGNYINNIYKVFAKDASGVYHELTPVDQQSIAPSTMTDGQNSTGLPTTYDKTGHTIFLDLIPVTGSVTMTKGLKLIIDRESTKFLSTDTTKKSGLDSLCDDYLYLKPSYEYCRDKGKGNTEQLFRDLQISMAKLRERYGSREKDVLKRMSPAPQDNH